MPPNPPRNAQRLRRARDMSSTCAWRPLLVLHNFPVFSLLLSIMPDKVIMFYDFLSTLTVIHATEMYHQDIWCLSLKNVQKYSRDGID